MMATTASPLRCSTFDAHVSILISWSDEKRYPAEAAIDLEIQRLNILPLRWAKATEMSASPGQPSVVEPNVIVMDSKADNYYWQI